MILQRVVIFLLIAISPAFALALEIYDVSSGFMHVTSVNGVKTQDQAPTVQTASTTLPPAPVAEGPRFIKADNTPVAHKPAVVEMDSQQEVEMDSQQEVEESSEVVGGNQPIEFSAGDSAPRTSPRPKARPKKMPQTSSKVTSTLYDMRGCTYGRGSSTNSKCYKSLSTKDRARRIMSAVNYVNQLHGTKFDGRYMLCTGWRESNFNPGAQGSSGERGMFQVMKDTGYGAVKYGVELPEFKNMTAEQYMTNMKNSTVAQVELSFLVLKMKLSENIKTQACQSAKAARSSIMGGAGTDTNYQNLAGCYNGGGTNSTYAKRIKSCLSCLRTKMSATESDMGTEIEPCLAKAK